METIVQDEEIRAGEPRVAGTRVTVLDLKRRVIDQAEDPHVVAGEYGISIAALFTALAYYYEHQAEFAEQEQSYATARREGEKRAQIILDDSTESAEQAE